VVFSDGSQNLVTLGSGGPAPRVEVYHEDSGYLEEVIVLPRRHSVYAADRTAGGALVVGTRKGRLLWITLGGGPGSPAARLVHACDQGAPVLSINFVTEDRIVVSDSNCHCSEWQRGSSAADRQFDTGHQVICSFLALDASNVVGLAATGNLLFWRTDQGEPVRTIRTIAPPPMSALVRLLYWPAADALIWPAGSGEVICYTLSQGDLYRFQAHEGEFYAITLLGNELITVGLQDARLKRWQAGRDIPLHQQDVPAGVISATTSVGVNTALFLVTKAGDAHLYRPDSERWKYERRIEGTDYRMALGSNAESLEALAARRRAMEAVQLLQSLATPLAADNRGSAAAGHQRLAELGYGHYSLALRARQAHQSDDVLEALRLYKTLYGLLPDDDANACDWLAEYADVLEGLGLFTSARSCYQRIGELSGCRVATERVRGLTAKLTALRTGLCMLEPSVPVPVLLEAAGVVGESLCAQLVVDRCELGTYRAELTPASIARKYEQLRQKNGDGALPIGECVAATWLNGQSEVWEETELVAFNEQDPNDAHGFRFVLRTTSARGQTSPTLIRLFSLDSADTPEASEELSRRALDQWNRHHDAVAQQAGQRKVRAAVRRVLGMLENEARAPLTL
jgi:hypothetical protein